MNPHVLVLIDSREEAPGRVEAELHKRKIPCATLDLRQVVTGENSLSFRIGRDDPGTVRFRDARTGEAVISTEVRSVWSEGTRVGSNPTLHFGEAGDPAALLRTLGESEAWLSAVQTRVALAHRYLFLPQMLERGRANYPLYQAALAADVGFRVPAATAAQSLAPLIKAAGLTGQEPVHYQPLLPVSFKVKGTDFVSVDRWLHLDRAFTTFFIAGPAYFSMRPAKGRRLVAGLVGSSLFAIEVRMRDAELDPQVTDIFYQAAQDNLDVSPVTLPRKAEDLCRSFMREAELTYGVLDFIEDDHGDYWMLAAHPGGNLLLFEDAGLPAYEALIAVLREGRKHA